MAQRRLPGLLAAGLVWVIGFHHVATLDYQHAVWRCGSVWNIEVNGDLPDATHADIDSNGDIDSDI